jgi:hypothetical protein
MIEMTDLRNYKVTVTIEVELAAYTSFDAREAVCEALEDIDALGARVTKLDLDSIVEIN